jgi:EAL domain-containing protein (putative c-di-GMP-specific phosphodiesterase class I)/CheY-like chemotaxis protein
MTARAVEKLTNSQPPGRRTGKQVLPAIEEGPSALPPADAFVIDDEVGICKFVSMTLANLGLTAESYHTASQVIAALERGHPDIVFLDLALEGSDAIEVLRMLGEKRYSGVVQLMSGTSPGLLDDVRRIGARHGLNMRSPLAKPFRGEAVRQAVASAQQDSPPEATFSLAPMIELGLDEALAKGWLELWYQPKIDLRTQALVGAEGLSRCRHPVHGMLSPAAFLPGASEDSLMTLTEHVVLSALSDWCELADAGVPLRIAVNASVGALTSRNLAVLIRENRPKREGWPGLILEVPEGEVVKDVALFHEIATQLRIYGITLAIDDFGEGFSSFARLRELPFGELKLDRGFVDGCAGDPRNAGICRAVIELAHQFGVVAVAEGLEDTADVHVVREMGCDIGQGYIFGRPMPKAVFLPLLRDRALANKRGFA